MTFCHFICRGLRQFRGLKMGDSRIYPRKRTYKFGQFQFKGILKYSIFSLLKTSRGQIDRVLFTDQEQCRIAVKTKCMRVSWKKTLLVSNKPSFHTRRLFVCFRTFLKYWIEFHFFRCKNSLPPSKAHLDSRRTKYCRLKDLVGFIKIKF